MRRRRRGKGDYKDFSSIRERIKSNYSLPIDNIEKIKNVYRITSQGNVYCFKIIKYVYGHFFFIYSAMKHLQNNGFETVPTFIPSIEEKDFIEVGNKHAYLTPWVNAREANYDNPIDVRIAALKLADLHEKSKGFIVTPEMKPRIGWLRWMKIFSTRKDEILDFKRRINLKEKKSEFDILYLKAMDKELERCDKAIAHLGESEYINKMKEEIRLRGFCHHDYANHNILINSNNEVNIIDFDYCMLDSHLHDLSSLIIRKMKDGKWNIESAQDILGYYSEINRINKDEIPIMAAFIEFPQAYWQLGIQYYWEEQPWGEEFFINKLNKIDMDKDERQEFVDGFREINL